MSKFCLRLASLLFVLLAVAIGGCDNSPSAKASRFIKKGDEYFSKGEFEKARIEYQDAGQALPNSPDPLYHVGLVDEAEGSYRIAFVAFNKALQQQSSFKPALLKTAEYFIASGQYDLGADRIDAVLKEDPADPQALALRSKQLYRQKQLAEAEKVALQALAVDPSNVTARSSLANIYDDQGDLSKALAVTEAGLAKQPQDLTLLRLRVGLLEKGRDLEATAHAYQALFQMAPDKVQYRTMLADDYVKANKVDKAEIVLREGVAVVPQNWEMKHDLVIFLDTHHSIGAPEKEIQSYLKDYPKRPEPVGWLATLYVEHGLIDKAAHFLDDRIASGGGDAAWAVAMNEKAEIVYKNGDKQTADELASKVLEKLPSDTHAAIIKTHIEADEGYYDQAIHDLRGLISAHPGLSDPYELLSQVYLRQGHVNLAIETLSQLNDKAPAGLELRVQLAELYAQNGDAKHAGDLLFLITKSDPTYVPAWEALARISLELKNWETAQTAIDQLSRIEGQKITVSLLQAEKFHLTNHDPEAIELFKKVIDVDVASPQAEIALTFFYSIEQQAKKFAEAAQYLSSVSEPTPLVNSLLGQCYVAMHYDKAAAAAFDKAIAAGAKFPEPYIGRARIYADQKENARAIALYEAAEKISGADTRAGFAEAVLDEDMGYYDAARGLYEDLLKKDPSDQMVSNNLAELIANYFYKDRGALDRAQELVGPFTASTNPLLLDTLAWVVFREDRLPEALSILDRAQGIAGQLSMPPEFHYHRGATLAAMDRRKEAIEELSLASKGNDPYPGRALVKPLLKAVLKSEE